MMSKLKFIIFDSSPSNMKLSAEESKGDTLIEGFRDDEELSVY